MVCKLSRMKTALKYCPQDPRDDHCLSFTFFHHHVVVSSRSIIKFVLSFESEDLVLMLFLFTLFLSHVVRRESIAAQ